MSEINSSLFVLAAVAIALVKVIIIKVVVLMVLRVILSNYLARTGKQCGLTAAMAISIPWNSYASAYSLEQPINALIFNKMLADELKQCVIRYVDHAVVMICY